MSEPKWTPGPWTLAEYKDYEGFSIWARDLGCIAERWWPTTVPDVPIKANALLIAAAPEEDAANVNTVNRLKCFINNPLPHGSILNQRVSDAIRAVVKQAEAALAKARGEV